MALLGAGFSGQLLSTQTCCLKVTAPPIIPLNLWKIMLYLCFLYRNLIVKQGQYVCTVLLNHECGERGRIKKKI